MAKEKFDLYCEKSNLISVLISECKGLSVDLKEDIANKMIDYLLYILDCNKKVNLTSITSVDNAIILHLVDSLLFVKPIIDYIKSPNIDYVDIGTGGGFPGIPIGLFLNNCDHIKLKGTLIDSTKKKTDIVNQGLKLFEIPNLEGQALRIEDFARNNPDSYNCVVARAVAPLSVLLEYSQPLLCMGGVAVFSKGICNNDELEDAAATSVLLGQEIVSRETYSLPSGKGQREIFVYKKVKACDIKLPRKNGDAIKRPLYMKYK